MIKMTAKERKIAVASLLFGVAVSDALGVPVEFRPRGSFPVAGMWGYGTHKQPPGTWSDDTSLTWCLADSLSPGFNPESLGGLLGRCPNVRLFCFFRIGRYFRKVA
jgi:ADP-ribosylglycohydrolase